MFELSDAELLTLENALGDRLSRLIRLQGEGGSIEQSRVKALRNKIKRERADRMLRRH